MASKVEQKKSSVGLITEKLFKFYTSKATIRLVSDGRPGTFAFHLPENPLKRQRYKEENLKQRRKAEGRKEAFWKTGSR